jgi:hypothetical protein
VAIRLASWLREAGKGAGEVEDVLAAWNRRNPEPLDEVEVAHVVASAFGREVAYHYGCRDALIEPWCPGGVVRCPYHSRERA